MGFFDEVFNEANMKAVISQRDAGKIKHNYRITIKEPVSFETTDENLAYKIKMLLNMYNAKYDMTKNEIDTN